MTSEISYHCLKYVLCSLYKSSAFLFQGHLVKNLEHILFDQNPAGLSEGSFLFIFQEQLM